MIKKGHLDVISKYFYPVSAGIETNILETYSQLANLGWTVTVHTTTDTLHQPNCLSESDEVRGIKIRRYHQSFGGFLPKLRFDESSLICLHNFNIWPHSLIYLIIWFRKIIGLKSSKIFLTPHGGFTPEWPTFSFISRILKGFYHHSFGIWFINSQTNFVRAISKWEQTELIRSGVTPEKIILIQNGLDKAALLNHQKLASLDIKLQIKNLGRYFVAVGRLAEIKNYETMIKAISLIKKSPKLVIIGPQQDEAYLAGLKKLAEKLNVAEKIKFIGPLKGSDKYLMVKQAICQIHMARWESFCNVVYEAKSLGQICLVANNTALASLISHNVDGILTETFDEVELSKKLSFMASNTALKLRTKIKNNLSQEAFPSWDVTAALMSQYYLRLVK